MKTPVTPHITEKAYATISEEKGAVSQYTFKIARTLTKEIVKRYVEKTYKVHVEDVRIINLPGKQRVFKGHRGATQARKKAIVRLQPGERIAAFAIESTEPKEETK
jgi:large subunit ribosomal protein L23